MWRKLKTCFKELPEIFKEAGVLSANRVTPICTIAIFTIVIIIILGYLMFYDRGTSTPWPYLGEVVTLYLGVFATSAAWLTGNKVTNSKYNTDHGFPGKPLTTEQRKTMNKVADAVEKVVDRVIKD